MPNRVPRMEQPLRILIDGDCPLCTRQGRALVRFDRSGRRLKIVDVTDPAFDPAEFGLSRDDVMTQIHAITPEGEVLRGMAVIRRAYREGGRGWLAAPTGWPIVRPVFDRFYAWVAAHRPRTCDADKCSPGDGSVDTHE